MVVIHEIRQSEAKIHISFILRAIPDRCSMGWERHRSFCGEYPPRPGGYKWVYGQCKYIQSNVAVWEHKDCSTFLLEIQFQE